MKNIKLLPIIGIIGLLLLGCEDKKSNSVDPIQLTTGDVNNQPQYYSFNTNEFADTSFDLKFMIGNQTYLVYLNSEAGVLAVESTGTDFDNATMPITGYTSDDGETLVIGDNWMDVTTYNPTDNHSIQSNGNIYFVRTADYHWVKLEILKASTESFTVKYAVMDSNNNFGATQEKQIDYSSVDPAYFNFSSGATVTQEEWHFGLTLVPEYEPTLNQFFYMPSVIFNDELIQVGTTNTAFEDLNELPASFSWLSDSEKLSYRGNDPILVYHPEPPYNHKVIVEKPDQTVIIDVGGVYYKVKFIEYSSGVLLVEFNEI